MKKLRDIPVTSPYELDGRLPLRQAFPLGLQHVLAMYVGNLTPIMIVLSACGIAASGALGLAILQNTVLVAGLVTLVQLYPIWKVGAKLPIVMGTSGAFMSVSLGLAVAAGGGEVGYGVVLGAVLVGGIFEFILGFFLQYLHKLFPPIVSGVIVMVIGLSLMGIGVNEFGGGNGALDYGSAENFFVAGFVLVAILIFKHYTKGMTSLASIVLGIVCGYVLCTVMGFVLPTTFLYTDPATGAVSEVAKAWFVDWSKVLQAHWIELPKLLPVKLQFRIGVILPYLLLFVITTIETIGDTTGVVQGGLNRKPTDRELAGSIMCDGLGSSLAALFGVLPNTSISQNVGLVSATRVVNRFAIGTGAVFLVLCGFSPKLAAVISVMPHSVLGGMMVMIFSSIVISGIQMIIRQPFTPKNMSIIAVSLGLGYGLGASSNAIAAMPEIVGLMFGNGGIVPAALIAIILNLVLPDSKLPTLKVDGKNVQAPQDASAENLSGTGGQA